MSEHIVSVSRIKPVVRNSGMTSDKKVTVAESLDRTPVSFSEKFFDSCITICISMLFLGIPVFFTGFTLQGIAFEKQLYFFFFLLFGIVFWIVKGFLKGGVVFQRTPLDIPLVLFWLTSLVSTVFSIDHWHSFFGMFGDPSRGFLSITSIVFSYYLIVQHATEKRLKYFFWSFIFSGSAVITWGLLSVMGARFIPEFLVTHIPLSLTGSISSLALFTSAMLPLFATAVAFSSPKVGKFTLFLTACRQTVLIFFSGGALFLLFVLNGFVPWVATFIGVSIFLVFILARVIRFPKNWIWFPTFMFFGILGAFMIGHNQLSRVQLPVEVFPDANLSWTIAKESLKEHTFFGSGLGTYQYVFSRFHPDSFNTSPLYSLRFTEGSSLLFEIISTMGIFGAVTFVFLILACVSVGFYLLSKNKDNLTFSLGAWSSSMVYIFSWFFVPTSGSVLLAGSLIFILAITVLFQGSGNEKNTIFLSLRTSPKYALPMAFFFLMFASGIVFLFVFAGKVFMADVLMGRAVKVAKFSTEDSIRLVGRAVELNSQEGYYLVQASQMYMLLTNNEAGKQSQDRNTEAARSYIESAVQLALRGRDMLPMNVVALESLAQVYDNAAFYIPEALSNAEEGYKKASELEPANPSIVLKLGQLILSRARLEEKEEQKNVLLEESKKIFEKSIQLKQDYAPGFFHLALVQDALNQKNEAIANMSKAVKFNSGSPDALFQLGQLYQRRKENDDEDIAEKIYKNLLDINQNNIQARFALGLLYDGRGEINAALKEFDRILRNLPESDSDTVRQEIQKIIENIQGGLPALSHRINNESLLTNSTLDPNGKE